MDDNNENVITKESKQFELEYKAILGKAIKRVDKYNQNLYEAYTFQREK